MIDSYQFRDPDAASDDPGGIVRWTVSVEARKATAANIVPPQDARPFAAETARDYYFTALGVDPACGLVTADQVARAKPCLDAALGDASVKEWVTRYGAASYRLAGCG